MTLRTVSVPPHLLSPLLRELSCALRLLSASSTYCSNFLSCTRLLSLAASLCREVSTLFGNHPLTCHNPSAAAETSLSECFYFPGNSSRSLIFHHTSWTFPKILTFNPAVLPPATPINFSYTYAFFHVFVSSHQKSNN